MLPHSCSLLHSAGWVCGWALRVWLQCSARMLSVVLHANLEDLARMRSEYAWPGVYFYHLQFIFRGVMGHA